MPAIRLPDGAVKQFDAPVSVADVAASIGPGLAKAALAGKVDGKLVDTSYVIDRDAALAIVTDTRSRGPRRPAPLDGAPARVRGEGALPRRAGDDRAGDRGRLLLRLLVQAAVHARGPRGDRAQDGRAREEGRAGRSHADAARRRGQVLRGDGRALQGRDHRVDPVGRADLALYRGQVHRPLPRPARAVDRQAQGVQADEARRRVLARRLEERDAAADLRHRVGEEGRPGRVPAPASRKPRSATTASSAASSTSSTSRTRRRAWCSGIRRAGRSGSRSSSTCAASYQDNGYQEVRAPQILDRSLWEKSGHWENFKDNMFTTESEKRDFAVKPMNCPGHVLIFNSDLRSYRDLPLRYGEFGACHRNEPSGALARDHARARLHAGRRPHLLHSRSRSSPSAPRSTSWRSMSTATSALPTSRSRSRCAPTSASATTRPGTAAENALRDALARMRRRMDRAAR